MQQFLAYVHGLGAAGPIVYTAVYAVCVVFLVPASLLTLGAGALFGVAVGSIVVTIGATLGATIAFVLARTVLRNRVRAFVARKPALQAIDRAIVRDATKLMLLMRVSGFPPFTWTNYVLGLTGARIVPYVLTTLFGILPGVFLITYAGAAAATGRIPLIVAAAGAVLVSAYIARITRRAIAFGSIDSGPGNMNNHERGFTILETLIVCAIIGMIAAIAIPMYMNAQDRARQARTMANMRTIASAWEARATEVRAYNAAGAATFTLPANDVALSDLQTILSPTYTKDVPATDGWGHDLEFYLDSPIGSSTQAKTYAVASPGRSGVLDRATRKTKKYTIETTTNFDCDIIYSNGSFVMYPAGKQD